MAKRRLDGLRRGRHRRRPRAARGLGRHRVARGRVGRGRISGEVGCRARGHGSGEQVLPVVEEELEVGKRRVNGGVVRGRVARRLRPGVESVDLRSEEAVIERRRVDAPARSEMAAFQERTMRSPNGGEGGRPQDGARHGGSRGRQQVTRDDRRSTIPCDGPRSRSSARRGRPRATTTRARAAHMGTSGWALPWWDGILAGVRFRRPQAAPAGTGSGAGMGTSGTMSSVGSSGSMGGATVTGATRRWATPAASAASPRGGRASFDDFDASSPRTGRRIRQLGRPLRGLAPAYSQR